LRCQPRPRVRPSLTMTHPTSGFGDVCPRPLSASDIASCMYSLSDSDQFMSVLYMKNALNAISTQGIAISIQSKRHRTGVIPTISRLPSGLSPLVSEFHRFSPQKGESRTVTASRGLHPALKRYLFMQRYGFFFLHQKASAFQSLQLESVFLYVCPYGAPPDLAMLKCHT